MRNNKILIYTLCITIIFSLIASSSVLGKELSHSENKNESLVLNGISHTNLEDTGIKTSMTEEVPVELSLKKFEIGYDSVYLEGVLSYNGQEYKISRSGLVQVDFSDNDVKYLEFNEYLSSDVELIFANVIIDSIDNTISFVLFNKSTKDLIKINGSLPSSYLLKLNKIDQSILTEVSPTYELYESRIFNPVNVGFEEEEAMNSGHSIFSNKNEDSKYLTAWVEYSNGYRHYLKYSVSLHSPLSLNSSQAVMTAAIRIEEKYIVDSRGIKIIDGDSELTLGSHHSSGTPISSSFTLTQGSNTIRDYITEIRWYGHNDSTTKAKINPFNIRLITALVKLTTNIVKSIRVSEGDTFTRIHYPQDGGHAYNVVTPYPNKSYLRVEDSSFIQGYTVNSMGRGNGAKKGARIRYTVPIYTLAGTLVATHGPHVPIQYSP